MVYYRKYRPQTINELIGQDQVKQTLLNAYKSNKLSHAYLFFGPKGTGKTSAARILAKIVNCQNITEKDETIPCNKCLSCKSIADGSNLDLIEIDAASNRGIDDIRALRETIGLSPNSSNKKVYIIDEVHMLTQEAFNALLKTLEEPPEHVLFILATTELAKLPQTIISRTTKLNFQAASTENLLDALKKVLDQEKLKADDDALLMIAKKSDGSFRDSLKLLEQLAAKEEKISLKMVEECIGTNSLDKVIKLLETISKGENRKALASLEKDLKEGVNVREYTLTIMDTLRVLLLIKYNLEEDAKEDIGSNNYPSLSVLSGQFTSEQLIKLIDLFQYSLEKLKFASIQSLPLEIAVIEGSSLKMDMTQAVFPEIKQKQTEEQPLSKEEIPQLKSDSVNDAVVPEATKEVTSEDMSLLQDRWNYILETIKPYNYSLEALLKQVKIASLEDNQLLLEVPYSFHQRILEAPKSRNLLESILSDVLGKEVRVRTVLGTRPVRVEELANVEVAADDDIIKIAAEIFNS
ncbi:DNA polymerase III subunit gamma/tau [Candidatus Daviesbacteria bacterium]|nr:DNA polymerase III subunit gamma/tau [Candidatus Daviesbacteria bacterium]